MWQSPLVIFNYMAARGKKIIEQVFFFSRKITAIRKMGFKLSQIDSYSWCQEKNFDDLTHFQTLLTLCKYVHCSLKMRGKNFCRLQETYLNLLDIHEELCLQLVSLRIQRIGSNCFFHILLTFVCCTILQAANRLK